MIIIVVVVLSSCNYKYCTYEIYQGGKVIDTMTRKESNRCIYHGKYNEGLYFKLIRSESCE